MIEGYEIVRALRESAVAPVYLARSKAGDAVVIKTVSVSPDPASVERMRERFNRLSAIRHPGTPRYLHLEVGEGSATWVHEYVEGEVLQDWIDAGRRFTEQAIFDFMAEILDILAVVHDAGVVHRDLKPENIVAKPDGSFALIDFAGANVWDASGNVSVLGTTGYAAPEQLVGGAEFSSDQYGLAATALHIATGRHPTEFPLRNLRIELENSGVSRGLEDTLEQMLEPDPTQRFKDVRSAAEIARARGARPTWEWPLTRLEDLDESIVTYEEKERGLEILIGPRPRRRTIAVTATLTLLSGVGIGYAVWTYGPFILFVGAYLLLLPWICWTELRRTSNVTLKIDDDGWTLIETAPFRRLRRSGQGPFTLTGFQRLMSRGAMADDTRYSLRLSADGKTSVVAPQLFPVEARAIADAVREFRQPSVALLEAEPDAQTALAPLRTPTEELEQRRADPIRWLFSVQGKNRALSEEAAASIEAELPDEFRRKVEGRGFRKLGGMSERTFMGLVSYKKLQWLSADGRTRLAASAGGESGSDSGVNYYLLSTLDDRRQVLTWSKVRVQTRNSSRLISTPTAGSFEADVASHQRLLAEARADGATALVMRDLDDSIAASTIFDRHTVPLHLALVMLVPYLYAVMIPIMILYFSLV